MRPQARAHVQHAGRHGCDGFACVIRDQAVREVHRQLCALNDPCADLSVVSAARAAAERSASYGLADRLDPCAPHPFLDLFAIEFGKVE